MSKCGLSVDDARHVPMYEEYLQLRREGVAKDRIYQYFEGKYHVSESTVKHRLPIINCPKCMTFWTVLGYGVVTWNDSQLSIVNYPLSIISVALLAAWAAIWLELFMGFIDQLYLKIYEQIYPTADPTDADA